MTSPKITRVRQMVVSEAKLKNFALKIKTVYEVTYKRGRGA